MAAGYLLLERSREAAERWSAYEELPVQGPVQAVRLCMCMYTRRGACCWVTRCFRIVLLAGGLRHKGNYCLGMLLLPLESCITCLP